MSRRGPEGKIQDAVVKYAKTKGALVKKNEVGRFFVSSGWPDVAIYPDRHIEGQRVKRHNVPFFAEFKALGGMLTPLQEHVRKEIEARGYTYYVVDSIAKGRMIVDQECS